MVSRTACLLIALAAFLAKHVSSDEVFVIPKAPDLADQTNDNPGHSQRIVGGTESYLGEFPWQGLLLEQLSSISNFYRPFCGCSLLSNTWAITATHCTEGKTTSILYVAFGIFDQENDLDLSDLYSLLSVYDHPDYNSVTSRNDISLLRINGAVTFNSVIGSIALPLLNVSASPGTTCVISGWGSTVYQGTGSSTLRKADVPIIDNYICNSWYNSVRITIYSDQVCAGYELGGVDTCQGDSGGPLACKNSNGTYLLEGITSFGVGCATAERPGVYTRVSDYINWIGGIAGKYFKKSCSVI
ncbi:unnamed protein product [Clavelina lepadiformis]|uniref:Peptidase S1 domain-containing protein n=1 Tax=Clavelina lepadiformis TaxID=159417 RepID=A0ABP0GM28_CLALP